MTRLARSICPLLQELPSSSGRPIIGVTQDLWSRHLEEILLWTARVAACSISFAERSTLKRGLFRRSSGQLIAHHTP